MNSQQHFWDLFFAWSLGLGFVLIIILTVTIAILIDEDKLHAPFSRAFERWHKQRNMERTMKLRAELIRKGIDPKYVEFMEKELNKQ